ncbi:MAG: nitroreductase family protein [Endomicrobiaceae bacterium]|nr:nitroreductase family protein [Endomicrobiaceae bacterium]
MEFLELVKKRYSERFFDSVPIEQEKIDKIFEAGRLVPTACNYQPQRFYVLKSKKALELAKEVTPFTYNSPLIILVCYDKNEVWKNKREEGYNSGEQDLAIAATTMMYEAESLGIHSLWIRGFNSKTASEKFNLPENIVPGMMLALGYPSENSKPSDWHFKRKSIEEIVIEL